MSEAQTRYTLKSSTRLGMTKNVAHERALFDHFLPELPASSKILEIGPGRGEFANECRSRNLSFYGIEASRDLFDKLQALGFEVINQTVPPIPTESECFNLVHSKHFVEHLSSYPDVMEFFSESYRVLKPSGYISVIAPNYRTIKHLFYQFEYQHTFITTKERLRNMLIDSGYEIVKALNYSLWLSPKLNKLDRLLANIIIPISINSLVQGFISTLFSENFLFRVHKTLYDHTAILGKKP